MSASRRRSAGLPWARMQHAHASLQRAKACTVIRFEALLCTTTAGISTTAR